MVINLKLITSNTTGDCYRRIIFSDLTVYHSNCMALMRDAMWKDT